MLAYLVGCLALIIKPGPDLMCTIATALSDGRARACSLMVGLIVGCWLWILLLTLGVASFFADHREVMCAIQVVGIAYIAYLAVQSFREAVRDGRGGEPTLAPARGIGLALVRRGIAMSMSNPLTILFFLAFLPGFTRDGAALSPAVQTLLLGTLFCVLVPVVYVPIILAADALRARLVGSRLFLAGLKALSGLILASVAVLLALNVLRPGV